MTSSDAGRQLEDLAHEIDLLVYRLEVARREPAAPLVLDALRRDLEQVREHVRELARGLERA